MATRQQIDRLAQRVERLAERVAPKWPKRWVTIQQKKYQGETEDQARAKYFASGCRRHPHGDCLKG